MALIRVDDFDGVELGTKAEAVPVRKPAPKRKATRKRAARKKKESSD